ncbi:MAG: Na+/H+ antiporter subunit E [Phycisphaerales bacterium]|nr:Na+/H+ antiporter subunit E [Phycisphaerales bacterium]
MIQTLSLVASLFAFWLLLSGYFEAFLLAAGLGSAVAVALFARRMHVADREGLPIDRSLQAVLYWPWLVVEILKSGWTVTRIILDPRLPISPTMVRFRPSQRSTVGLVTHANSITLTPGTLTVEASESEFVVHGLTTAGAEGCIDSEMDRRVSRFEGQR